MVLEIGLVVIGNCRHVHPPARAERTLSDSEEEAKADSVLAMRMVAVVQVVQSTLLNSL